MPVIENNQPAHDPWLLVDETADIAGRSMVIVPLSRLEEAVTVWPEEHRGLGIALPNDAGVNVIVPYLARFDIIALDFPAFSDGRAFSQARSLRHVHGFTGIIRARGRFIPDQYAMLLQSGIDSIEVDDRFTLQEWTSQIRAVPSAYQRDYAAGAGLATRTFAEAASWAEQPHFG